MNKFLDFRNGDEIDILSDYDFLAKYFSMIRKAKEETGIL